MANFQSCHWKYLLSRRSTVKMNRYSNCDTKNDWVLSCPEEVEIAASLLFQRPRDSSEPMYSGGHFIDSSYYRSKPPNNTMKENLKNISWRTPSLYFDSNESSKHHTSYLLYSTSLNHYLQYSVNQSAAWTSAVSVWGRFCTSQILKRVPLSMSLM